MRPKKISGWFCDECFDNDEAFKHMTTDSETAKELNFELIEEIRLDKYIRENNIQIKLL